MMKIRHAVTADLAQMMDIYDYARRFMAAHGNPNQWGPTNWPPEEQIRSDIALRHSYVCTCGDDIVGTFFFQQGRDVEPSYRTVHDGAWRHDGPYGVIHRLAGSGAAKGIGSFCIDWAFAQCGYLRVDTHGDNHIMQRLLEKQGFVQCGIIYVAEDCYPRLAYDKCRPHNI